MSESKFMVFYERYDDEYGAPGWTQAAILRGKSVEDVAKRISTNQYDALWIAPLEAGTWFDLNVVPTPRP